MTICRDPEGTVAQARATLYLRQRTTLWAGNLGLQLVAVVVLFPVHRPDVLALWVGMNAAILLLRVRATTRLRRGDVASAREIDAWFQELTGYILIAGLVWGVGAFLLMPSSSDPRALVLLLILMGVCWGAAVSLSTHYPAVVAFVVPVALPVAAQLALRGTELDLLMVLLTLAFMGFVLATARNYAHAVDASLRLGSKNLALLADVSAARDAAERASAEKSRFLAAVSHDLRQPLHAVRLSIEALHTYLYTPAQQDALADSVHALRSLETQLDALLELSELDAGALKARPCEFPLGPLLDELAHDFAPSAHARGLALEVATSSAYLLSDPGFLRRILRNLLDNAIKYTEHGGVAVMVRENPQDIMITVADSGPGIEPALVERIFEPYLRLSGAGREPGHGLGLAIVRQLCALLGTTIEVDTTPGDGSRFRLALPRGAPGVAREGDEFTGVHVLLVEDDAPARAALAAMLDAWGCLVSAGVDLDAALGVAGCVTRPADVIISDYRLSGGEDGFAVVARARELLDPALPALFVSGEADVVLQARANALGASLLRKPVAASALRATLATLVLE